MLWVVLILITPYCLGLPWRKLEGTEHRGSSLFFTYVTGYFIRLTLFHVICLPVVILRGQFSLVCHLFSLSLINLSAISAFFGRKNIYVERINFRKWLKTHSIYERIYLAGFIVIFLFQIFQIIRMDVTYMGYDDASYTTYGSNALATDLLFQTDAMTGSFTPLTGRRLFSTALIYNAWITRMTGIPITMVMRTVQAVYVFTLAYMAYAYMADDLFPLSRENQYIFLLILSFLYLFGYYSHYSTTFRLLGPNTQGKAIATTVLTPLLLILMKKKMAEPYDWKVGLLLMHFSHAATGLSLWGMGMVVIAVVLSVVLSMLRKNRNWKHLLYIVWVGFFPALYLALYMTVLT